MLKRYHRTVGVSFRVLDAVVIGLVWLLSFWLRFTIPLIEVTKGFPSFETYAALMPLIMILWASIFSVVGVYAQDKILRRTHEVWLILRAHALALVVFLALTYFFSEYRYSRGVMIYFGLLGAFTLVIARLGSRNLVRTLRRKEGGRRRVLAVGEGRSLGTLVARVKKFPELDVEMVGVLVGPESQTRELHGVPVIGRFSEVEKYLTELAVTEVLIALERTEAGRLDSILKTLKDVTVDIQIVPDLHEYLALGCAVEDFDGIPIVNLNDSPLEGWSAWLKRGTDIVCSAIALLVLAPLLMLIGIIVKLTSPGPVIYRQERMGLDGRTFQMLKFRSMKLNAELQTGAVWAQENDDRRTVVGTFLRRTSLDELPQFMNVLRGEMSLVGPRPERPVFVGRFRNEIPHYMLRHKVRAGLTGWAQVNGLRGNTSLSDRIQYDLYYIRNWSYLLDWKIMVMTVWKGFVHRNAY